MERENNTNQVTLSGEIASEPKFSHEIYKEGFYIVNLLVQRLSGDSDNIQIMVSERLIDIKADWKGKFVRVLGQFRSYNKHDEKGNHLELFVFAKEFENITEEKKFGLKDENIIFLDSYLCKPPLYRKTPLGREIADILLAVNRPYGKTDYIPCICWGRNARFVDSFEVGSHIQVWGRIQSREYQKKLDEDEFEKRIAYEVSVTNVEVIEDEQNKD